LISLTSEERRRGGHGHKKGDHSGVGAFNYPHEKLSPAIRDIAWKGQIRLCSRYRRLAAADKSKVVVTTAIAREMVGFIWAIARIAQPALQG
jgi:hypothetical protein